MSRRRSSRLNGVDLVRGPLPSWSERRVITIAPGDSRPFVDAEWVDSLVVLEHGAIDIECHAGSHRAFRAGDLLWFVGLRLKTIHNRGDADAVLVAISRSYPRAVGLDEPHPELRAALRGMAAASPEEGADLASTLWVAETGDPWSRSSPLHVTCSALVVHPPTQRVLLRWHERQQAWLQVGGHADPGETDPFAVARREAVEETGLTDLRAWPGPDPTILHLVVVPVAAGKGEPAHEHADLRYLLATDAPDAVVAEAASAPLRWLTLAGARDLTSEDNLRETLARAERLLGH
jgi:8-oxo-dGTP pyrophosphatase MutT (NUDIX family)